MNTIKSQKSKTIKLLAIFGVCVIAIIVAYAIYRQIEDYRLQDDPKLKELKEVFSKFFNQDRYWGGKLSALNDRDITKETDLYRGEKSYTINKVSVYICLKDENNEYYSLNMLIYVLAHEYSHVICESIGHTDEFHAIFAELLVELTDAGIYDPAQPIMSNYCKHGDSLK